MLTYIKDYIKLEQACKVLSGRLQLDYVLEVDDLLDSVSDHDIKTYSKFYGSFRLEKRLPYDFGSVDYTKEVVKGILEEEKEALEKSLITSFDDEMVKITLENIGINYEHEFIYLDLEVDGLLAYKCPHLGDAEVYLPNDDNLYGIINKSTSVGERFPKDLILNSDLDKLFRLLSGAEVAISESDQEEKKLEKFRRSILYVLDHVTEIDESKKNKPGGVFSHCERMAGKAKKELTISQSSFQNYIRNDLKMDNEELKALINTPSAERESFLEQFPKTS